MASELIGSLEIETGFLEMKSELLAKIKAEELEMYNRRENVKIFGMQESVEEKERTAAEQPKETLAKMLDMGSKVNENDIYIAHYDLFRLCPSPSNSPPSFTLCPPPPSFTDLKSTCHQTVSHCNYIELASGGVK